MSYAFASQNGGRVLFGISRAASSSGPIASFGFPLPHQKATERQARVRVQWVQGERLPQRCLGLLQVVRRAGVIDPPDPELRVGVRVIRVEPEDLLQDRARLPVRKRIVQLLRQHGEQRRVVRLQPRRAAQVDRRSRPLTHPVQQDRRGRQRRHAVRVVPDLRLRLPESAHLIPHIQ
jgi:hypothetical protein